MSKNCCDGALFTWWGAWLKTSVDLQHPAMAHMQATNVTECRCLCICLIRPHAKSGFLKTVTDVAIELDLVRRHFYFKGIFPEAEEGIEEYVGE